jgi:tetraacyldisaccharide 4'-kinase
MLSPEFINELWYGKHPLSLLLAPLGWLYKLFMTVRRLAYQAGLLPVKRVNVPVIIVGNMTAGGTGKTPLVIWLAEYLKKHNFRPGIVSRGYGGSATHWPQQVRPDSDPVMVGDEPIVIARHTGCPVAASPDRYTAVVQLLEHQDCNIIICDDGLQHHALARDIEIAVIDAVRRFGNGRCIPAGPLRESLSRLKSVDMVVSNGKPGHGEYPMEYAAKSLRSLIDPGREIPAESFRGKTVHAVAGIGHPARFFSMLRSCGMGVIEHEFPDHHRFGRRDIRFGDDLPVVMTEKDAVKCMNFAEEYHWYLEIDVRMNNIFEHRFSNLLKDITDGQKAA